MIDNEFEIALKESNIADANRFSELVCDEKKIEVNDILVILHAIKNN